MTHESPLNHWETTYGGRARIEELGVSHSFGTQDLYASGNEADDSLAEIPELSFTRIEEIGRGGMGTVYRALQHVLAREVAIKTLHRERSGDRAAFRGFVIEARVNGLLEHPNIVPVYDLQRDEAGELALAMKLVSGQSWDQRLRDGKEHDLVDELEILLAVCNGVAFAHSRGILHDDLKPANIMLGPFGEVLVMDWGLAAAFTDAPRAAGIRGVSSFASGCGTPAFASPELLRGATELLGPASDVYLLGGILYLILSDRPPHRGDTVAETITCACLGEIDPLPDTAPEELAAICRRALSLDPAGRYPSVAAFQEALRLFLRHRESLGITEQAQAALDTCQDEAALDALDERTRLYTGYADAVAGFGQAVKLWNANEAARQGERRARIAWAGAALRLGDLGLAETQAQLVPGRATEDLEAGIEAERTRRRRETRSRRLLRTALAITGALVFCAVLYVWRQEVQHRRESEVKNQQLRLRAEKIEAQQAAIVEERDRAQQRGAIAQRALEGLTVQVHDLFRDIGDERAQKTAFDILQFALREWLALRETRQPSTLAPRGEAEAHLRMADLRLEIGLDASGSGDELEAAAKILRSLHPLTPESTAVRGRLQDVLHRLLMHYGNAGDFDAVIRTDREVQQLATVPTGTRARDSLYVALRKAEEQAREAVARDDERAGEEAVESFVALTTRLLAMPDPAKPEELEQLSRKLADAAAFSAILGLRELEDSSRRHALRLCRQRIATDILCGLTPLCAELLIGERKAAAAVGDTLASALSRRALADLVGAMLEHIPGGNLAKEELAWELHDLGHALETGVSFSLLRIGDAERDEPERVWAVACFDAARGLYETMCASIPENRMWLSWQIENVKDLLVLERDPELKRARIEAVLPKLRQLAEGDVGMLAFNQGYAARLESFAAPLQELELHEQVLQLQGWRVRLQRQVYAEQKELSSRTDLDPEELQRILYETFGLADWVSPLSALASALNDLAWARLQAGQAEQALEAFEEAAQLLRLGPEAAPLRVAELASVLQNWGITLWLREDPRATAILDEYNALAVRCLTELQLKEFAETPIREALLMMEYWLEREGRSEEFLALLEVCFENLARRARLPEEDPPPGWQRLRAAVSGAVPLSSKLHCDYINLARQLGGLRTQAEGPQAGLEPVRAAIAHARELVRREPESEHQLGHLINALAYLGDLAWEAGVDDWRVAGEELVNVVRRRSTLLFGLRRSGGMVISATAGLARRLAAVGEMAAAEGHLQAAAEEMLQLLEVQADLSTWADFKTAWEYLDSSLGELEFHALAQDVAERMLAAIVGRLSDFEGLSDELIAFLDELEARRVQ